MANIVDTQNIEEGHRNAVVKITAVLDTVDLNIVSIIKLENFRNNDPTARLTGFRFDHCNYSMGQQLDALLSWNGAVPQPIVPLARSGKIDVSDDGGLLPDTTRTGYDGSINLKTSGFVPGSVQNLTLIIRLVKLYAVR